MAQQVNLIVDQGSSWSSNVTIYTSNSTGTFPANLYHYAVGHGQIRRTYNSSLTANIAVNVHPAGSGNNGIITLTMNSYRTSAITAGRYIYDIELRGGPAVTGYSDGSQEYKTLRACEGIISVMPQATQHYWPGLAGSGPPIEWKFTSDTGGWVALRKTLNDFIGQPIKQWTGGLTKVAGAEGTWDGTYDTEGEPNYLDHKYFISAPRFHPDSEDPTKSILTYTREQTTGGPSTRAKVTAHIVTQATDDDGNPGSTDVLQPKDFVNIPNAYTYEGDWTLDGKRFAFTRHANNTPTDQTLTGTNQDIFPWRRALADTHKSQRGSMSDIWLLDEAPVHGINNDGTNARQISSSDATGDGLSDNWWTNQIAWDPTGKHVIVYKDGGQSPETNLYQDDDPKKPGSNINTDYSIWVLNVDGHSAAGLTDPPDTLSNGTGFSQYPIANNYPWSSEHGVYMKSFGMGFSFQAFGPDPSANNRYILTHNAGSGDGLANSTPSDTFPDGTLPGVGAVHSGKYTELQTMGGSDLVVMGYEGNAGRMFGSTTGPAAGTANIAQFSGGELLTMDSDGARTTIPVFWSNKGIFDTNCRMTDGSPTVSISTSTALAVAEWLARENYLVASGTIDDPISVAEGVVRSRPLVIGDGIPDHTFCKTVDLEATPPTIQLVDWADVAVNATKTVSAPDYAPLKIGGDRELWASSNPDGTCISFVKDTGARGGPGTFGGPRADGGSNEMGGPGYGVGAVSYYDGTGAIVLTGDGQPMTVRSTPDHDPHPLGGHAWWGPGKEIAWTTHGNVFTRNINSHFNGLAGTTVERNTITNALKVTGIGGEGLATTERFHGIIHSDNALGSENATRISIDTTIHKIISIRIKRTKEWKSMNLHTEEFTGSGWYGRLYWSTSRDDYFTQRRSIAISEPTIWGTDYIDLSWPVGTNAAWTGTVDKIKILFNKIEMWHEWCPLGEYEIESITVGDVVALGASSTEL